MPRCPTFHLTRPRTVPLPPSLARIGLLALQAGRSTGLHISHIRHGFLLVLRYILGTPGFEPGTFEAQTRRADQAALRPGMVPCHRILWKRINPWKIYPQLIANDLRHHLWSQLRDRLSDARFDITFEMRL